MSGQLGVSAPAGRTPLRPDIEGLRAIAVGIVLLYHVGVPGLDGGFAGVDVFFVISGYLITSLLLREEARTGGISIVSFYARRARRLLPAATLVLGVTAVAGYLLLPASGRANLGSDVVAATLYVVNWTLAARAVDYLAEGAAVSPVQHYWSLSVEEQYYVVWPLLMIAALFLARRAHVSARRVQGGAIGAVLVASLVWSVVHTASDPAASYFVTTTRVWELAIGSLLAFATARLARLGRALTAVLASTGLLLIAMTVLFIDAGSTWPGWLALLPTIGTALVIAAGCSAYVTPPQRLLGLAPMVWLGGLSYSLYLWHWPVVVIADVRYPAHGALGAVAVVAISVALAWLTKRYVEDPIRFSPRLVPPRAALTMGAVAMSLAVLAGIAVHTTAPELQLREVPGARALVADRGAVPWTVRDDPETVEPTDGPLVPEPAVAIEDLPVSITRGCHVGPGVSRVKKSCVYGHRRSDTTMVMLGDSKSGQWFSAVRAIADREQWRLQVLIKNACSFSTSGGKPDCTAYGRNVLDYLEATGVPDYAFVSSGGNAENELDAFTAGQTDALRELQALGTKIVLVADTPTPDSPAIYTCVEQHRDDLAACGFPTDRPSARAGVGTGPLQVAADELGLDLVDLNEWICPPGPTCPPAIGGALIYRQGSHLTDTYIRTLTPMVHRALSELGVAKRPAADVRLSEVPRPRH